MNLFIYCCLITIIVAECVDAKDQKTTKLLPVKQKYFTSDATAKTEKEPKDTIKVEPENLPEIPAPNMCRCGYPYGFDPAMFSPQNPSSMLFPPMLNRFSNKISAEPLKFSTFEEPAEDIPYNNPMYYLPYFASQLRRQQAASVFYEPLSQPEIVKKHNVAKKNEKKSKPEK